MVTSSPGFVNQDRDIRALGAAGSGTAGSALARPGPGFDLARQRIHNIFHGLGGTIDEDRIQWAAREVHADEFVQKLPEKYQDEVRERGAGLSVGQKQQIGRASCRERV